MIAENAGANGAVTGTGVIEKGGNYGFNAETREFGDLAQQGIPDPAGVVRVELERAGSLAGILLTTKEMVTGYPEPKEKAAAPSHKET